MHPPLDALSADTLALTMGTGDVPIGPNEPSLLFLAEPVSFRLQDGASLGSVYALNWSLTPDSLAGLDSSTLSLRSFDEASGEWVEVPASFTPGFPVISASDVSEGIYAVFAQESTDAMPPSSVADLAATTGKGGWGVMLNWTAPGDDGAVGQAVRYHVLFNSKPITAEDLSGCMELPMRGAPLPAGQSEQHSFEMPDPDTHY